MATTYIPLSAATPEQNALRNLIRELIETRDNLLRKRNAMTHMIDGATYTAMESVFAIEAGWGDDAFAELDAFLQKINGSGNDTAGVFAALNQLAAKFNV
jgi:predicted RecB family endonuclease